MEEAQVPVITFLSWISAGRQMWLEGKKDSEIADEFGIAASTVAAYRKRHWEKMLPQQTLNAIRRNAKEAGGKVLLAGARIEMNCEGNNQPVTPMGTTAPAAQGSALEGMEPVPTAALIGPGAEMKHIVVPPIVARNDTEEGCIPPAPVIIPKMDPLEGVKKQLPNVMDVMAAATDHLNGMKAVCTGCAIQALWFWRNAEDLRQAKRNIDYLLHLLEEKDGTN